MPINILFDEKEAQDLIDFYTQKQRAIKGQMATLAAELKSISAKILDLKQGIQSEAQDNPLSLDSSEYNIRWHWVKKIEFAITKAGKPLTTNEIVDILQDYQPEFIVNRRSAIASVSATLSAKSGSQSQHKEFVKMIADWGGQTFDIWKEIPEDINEQKEPETSLKEDDLPF